MAGAADQAIEQIYQKKTQLEHIILRPDTYIGSVEFCTKTPMWVYDQNEDKIVQREITYVPGLYKIFDEILVNAADNKQRDPKMNLIKVTIDKAKNEISVYNNGRGIPVVMHKGEKMYVPELIFGTLLTSSNYNDDEGRVTGGRNGFGAKLCNVFSTRFTLETSSKEYGRKFKQTWVKSMTKQEEPTIEKSTGEDFTRVTFQPDLKKFSMKELDDDIIALMSRRAYDVAGTCKGVKVFLNGRQLPCQGFKEYVELFLSGQTNEQGEKLNVAFDMSHPRWEIAVTVSDKNFQQVSFVNSIATSKGGRHVDYIADQLVARLVETVRKKIGKNSITVKPFQIKNHMWLFVNCLVENPTFDGQTKETMTLQSKSFGSKCELTEKFVKAAHNTGIVESILSWVRFKESEQADKKCSSKKSSKVKVAKLEDAAEAGTKNSHLCTLILTEGDSAKSTAVAGLAVVGRDRYGVFPLRGKMLNVRDANHKQIMENQEINNVLKALGLQYKLKYADEAEMNTLRYGKVMVMADQDLDGSHIKGLFVNFVHHNWPQLVRSNFIEEFITPIVKAIKKRGGAGGETVTSRAFYSIPEYVEWRQNTPDWKSYTIKYYKGLGTSTSKEAKEYFSDMLRHRIPFNYRGNEDDSAVELAFSKKKVEERKEWLTNFMETRKVRRMAGEIEDYLYNKETRSVTYSDFINKELVHFSNADNERSIPSLVDGLKPGQRKVMFTVFARNSKKEVKVAQLAGAVSEKSAYHHGEASLMQTIVGLAHDFVGSNNINLLLPIGQFGTRLQGGKDSASPRYIYTAVNPVTPALFPSADEPVLRHLYEENLRIEPEWYCPVIPTVLVNGAEGIGTGWSTKIPNYNPRDIVANIRRLINGEQMKPMLPWYKNFRGTIVQLDDTRYVCSGEVAVVNRDTLEITELPIKTWTQNYRESVIDPLADATPPAIRDYSQYHSDQTVKFVVKMDAGELQAARDQGLHNYFKLQTTVNTSHMVLFDAEGCMRKFDTPEEICQEFFKTRKQLYIDRKHYLEGMLSAQSERLSEQARFILLKIQGAIVIENKRKTAIIEQLVRHKFKPDPVRRWKDEQNQKELQSRGEAAILEEEEEEEEDEDAEGTGQQAGKATTSSSAATSEAQKAMDSKVADYDYLVGLAMWKLSQEEKDKLLAESEAKKAELRVLQAKQWNDLWEEDLVTFLTALDKQEKKELADLEEVLKLAAKRVGKDGKGKAASKSLAQNVASMKPDPNADRVEPDITAIKQKFAPKSKASKRGTRSDDVDSMDFEEGGEEGEEGSGKKKRVAVAKPRAKKATTTTAKGKATGRKTATSTKKASNKENEPTEGKKAIVRKPAAAVKEQETSTNGATKKEMPTAIKRQAAASGTKKRVMQKKTRKMSSDSGSSSNFWVDSEEEESSEESEESEESEDSVFEVDDDEEDY